MICTISPAKTNCEYTLNTLKYADWVKELRHGKSTRDYDELMLPWWNGKASNNNKFEWLGLQ